MQTLLLNIGYEPIRILSWQRAVTLLWLDKVDVVSEYDKVLRSSELELNVPAVIRLKRYHTHAGKIRFRRDFVYARDRWKCQYCLDSFPTNQLTYDHVIPRSQGGKTSWENIVTACGPCNHSKGNRTPEQAGMKLAKKPRKPKWFPFLVVKSIRDTKTVPEQWKQWIEWLL